MNEDPIRRICALVKENMATCNFYIKQFVKDLIAPFIFDTTKVLIVDSTSTKWIV